MKTFSPKEAIKFGWEIAKPNWKFFLGVFAVNIVLSLFPKLAGQENFLRTLLEIISSVLSFFLNMRLVRALLEFSQGGVFEFRNLFVFEKLKTALNFFLSEVLSALIFLAGLILLIIPGIIFAYRLSFTQYFVLDKNLGAIDAVKESWKVTKGSVLNLIALSLLSLLILIAGVLALVVGLLWAFPTVMVAQAYVYRKLSK